MTRYRTIQLGWKAVAVLFMLLLPMFLREIDVHFCTEIIIFSLFAISLNLVLRGVGLLSFGHAAFFGIGAYSMALISQHMPGIPLLLLLLIVALAGCLATSVIGFFCVRANPQYFPLLTLAFQMLLYAVALKWRTVTGGDDGMVMMRPDLYLPFLETISLMAINNLYYFTLIIVALAISGCYLLLKTPLGNAFFCIRENPTRASFLGYNVFLTKLTAFTISGFLSGLAGGLYALFQEFVSTATMDVHMSFGVLMMLLIGGVGHFLGPVLGVAFMVFFQNWLSGVTSHWPIFVGIVFIVVVRYLDKGLVGIFDLKPIRFLAGGRET